MSEIKVSMHGPFVCVFIGIQIYDRFKGNLNLEGTSRDHLCHHSAYRKKKVRDILYYIMWWPIYDVIRIFDLCLQFLIQSS